MEKNHLNNFICSGFHKQVIDNQWLNGESPETKNSRAWKANLQSVFCSCKLKPCVNSRICGEMELKSDLLSCEGDGSKVFYYGKVKVWILNVVLYSYTLNFFPHFVHHKSEYYVTDPYIIVNLCEGRKLIHGPKSFTH